MPSISNINQQGKIVNSRLRWTVWKCRKTMSDFFTEDTLNIFVCFVALSCAIATLMLKIHSSKVLSWGTDVRKGCQNGISCDIKLLLHSAVCKGSNSSARFYFPTANQWLFLHRYGRGTVSLNVSTSAPCSGQWLIPLFPPIVPFLSRAHVHLERLAACVWMRGDTTHKGREAWKNSDRTQACQNVTPWQQQHHHDSPTVPPAPS